MVTVVPEVAGEGEHVRIEVAEFEVVVSDAVGIGAGASEEGGAGGVADRLLAIGTLEKAPARGELVDVGGDGVFGAVATEFGAEIIDCDEEDVGLLRSKS